MKVLVCFGKNFSIYSFICLFFKWWKSWIFGEIFSIKNIEKNCEDFSIKWWRFEYYPCCRYLRITKVIHFQTFFQESNPDFSQLRILYNLTVNSSILYYCYQYFYVSQKFIHPETLNTFSIYVGDVWVLVWEWVSEWVSVMVLELVLDWFSEWLLVWECSFETGQVCELVWVIEWEPDF